MSITSRIGIMQGRLSPKIGGKIHLCPWMKTSHIGTYHFQGDMPAVANFVGEM